MLLFRAFLIRRSGFLDSDALGFGFVSSFTFLGFLRFESFGFVGDRFLDFRGLGICDCKGLDFRIDNVGS